MKNNGVNEEVLLKKKIKSFYFESQVLVLPLSQILGKLLLCSPKSFPFL